MRYPCCPHVHFAFEPRHGPNCPTWSVACAHAGCPGSIPITDEPETADVLPV